MARTTDLMARVVRCALALVAVATIGLVLCATGADAQKGQVSGHNPRCALLYATSSKHRRAVLVLDSGCSA
jgi:hypothetical protein